MTKCNQNCFECPYEDCIVEGILPSDRVEIKQRDDRYFNASELKTIIQQKSQKARKRKSFAW